MTKEGAGQLALSICINNRRLKWEYKQPYVIHLKKNY